MAQRVGEVRGDMNLIKLFERYGNEDRCREALERLRWPDGVRCPRCGSDKISRIAKRNQYDCDGCRYQFSVRAGTVFHDSHLPLWKWFVATYLVCESKKGISANQLKRTLGVSYKTAWYLCHRIRFAMVEIGGGPLEGVVEIDETYIGGKASLRGRRGGYGHKKMVMGALERDGEIRLKVGTTKNRGRAIQRFVKSSIAEGATLAVYTDGHNAYESIKDVPHEVVDHSADEWVRGDVSTNGIESAWSLLKRSIVGSYHQLSEKHLQAYMDEFSFRFNNRENPFLFRDTLLRLVEADALPYAHLIAST